MRQLVSVARGSCALRLLDLKGPKEFSRELDFEIFFTFHYNATRSRQNVGIDAKFESAGHVRRADYVQACAPVGEAAHRAIDRRASALECDLASLENASPDARIKRCDGLPLRTSVSTLRLRLTKGAVGAAQESFDVGPKTIEGGHAEARREADRARPPKERPVGHRRT
jgi:hypothetical protein